MVLLPFLLRVFNVCDLFSNNEARSGGQSAN